MEKQRDQLDRFCCPICKDLPNNPVTIPCGHSYCMSCIKTHWDTQEKKKIYSCPECRQTFSPRPELVKNTMLAGLVEELKRTRHKVSPVDQSCAGPEDVACDVCTGSKLKALKSCLVCLASYCEKHLQPHNESSTFKKHKLVAPTKNICSRHGEVMTLFCRTDDQCICYMCSGKQHKGHDIVTAIVERTERQRELELSQEEIQQRIKDREKDVKVLQQEVEAVNCSADKAMDNSEKIFTELMSLTEKRRSDVKHHVKSQKKTAEGQVKELQEKLEQEATELIGLVEERKSDVTQQIRSHRETEVSRVKELQEKLEQEITELKRKDTKLKQLSHINDHNQFIYKFSALSPFCQSTHPSSINVRPLRYFKNVTTTVSQVTGQLLDILTKTGKTISQSDTVNVYRALPEPESRDDFLQYSQEFTLDPNTAHTRLLLSEGNRKVTNMREHQSYSTHPDRFTYWLQVLSTDGLTGRCYWEVEWRGDDVCIAVTYKDIKREGSSDDCWFGSNEKSWTLICYQNSYDFYHNSDKTPLSGPVSSRVGVYLDHTAGILCFYSISDTMTLLHRVQTTFTQPLYAGLSVYYIGDTAEIC